MLLQPERINACAQAVIRTLQADEHQRGCLMEERVLKGGLAYESSMPRLVGDEERFVLLAMHQTLVERGFPSPSGRKRIAQRFNAGFAGQEGNKSRQGRKNILDSTGALFRPYGAWTHVGIGCPPLKRWAIFGRP